MVHEINYLSNKLCFSQHFPCTLAGISGGNQSAWKVCTRSTWLLSGEQWVSGSRLGCRFPSEVHCAACVAVNRRTHIHICIFDLSACEKEYEWVVRRQLVGLMWHSFATPRTKPIRAHFSAHGQGESVRSERKWRKFCVLCNARDWVYRRLCFWLCSLHKYAV